MIGEDCPRIRRKSRDRKGNLIHKSRLPAEIATQHFMAPPPRIILRPQSVIRLTLNLFRAACIASAAPVLAACGETARPGGGSPPSVVPVEVTAGGMIRGGKPYFVKGAGGSGSLEKLAARGANSIRTWDTTGLANTLDRAGKLGLTVSAGIWLEPESSWFSYRNPAHCDKQAGRVREQVLLHRHHPALLAWGLGNEAEGDGTNAEYWRQLDRLAKLVKELDPAHPTFTAVAGASRTKVEALMKHAPHLDFLGINTYAAALNLRRHLHELGWERPWMLTEWGPRGFWESPKCRSGAPLEQTSSEKAEMIRRVYQTAVFPSGGCLGSYVFVWGWKFEATATWFGVFTHQGDSTAVADALQEMWSGTRPANHAPAIGRLTGVPKTWLTAAAGIDATAPATDPDGDPLAWHWAVLPESEVHNAAKRPPMPKPASGVILKIDGDRVTVKAPDKPGVYRLHVWVKDGRGHAATANSPFEVR